MAEVKLDVTVKEKGAAQAASAIDGVGDAAQGASKSSAGFAGALKALGPVAAAAGAAVAAAGVAVGALAAKIGVESFRAAEQISILQKKLAIREGGGAATAAADMVALKRAAEATGSTVGKLSERFLELRDDMPTELAEQMVVLSADLTAAGQSADGLTAAIGLIGAGGIVPFKKLTKVADELGTDIDSLASGIGVSTKELERMAKEGKLTGEQLAKGALEATKRFKGMSKDTMPIWDRIQNAVGRLFERIGEKLAPALQKLAPILEAFEAALEKIDVEALSKIADDAAASFLKFAKVAATAIGLVVGFLSKLKLPPEFVTGLKVIAVTGLVVAAVVGAMTAAALVLVGILGGALVASIGVTIDQFKFLFAAVGSVATFFSTLGDRARDGAGLVAQAFTELKDKAIEWGTNMIDGMVNGIKSGIDRAVAAAKDLATKVSDTVKGALKIGSPSKLFESFGSFTAQGFALGMEGESQAVARAGAGLAGGAAAGAQAGAVVGAGFAGITNNSNRTSTNVGDVNITVQGGTTNEETATRLTDALRQFFRDMSHEAGGATA